MYGTIARIKIDPSKLQELIDLGQRMGTAPGQIARYVYQMDADPGEMFLVAVFESKEAYWANAQSPILGTTITVERLKKRGYIS